MINTAFRDFEHGFWNVTATPYDSGVGQVTAQTVNHILQKLNLPAGASLLDIACGPGYVTGKAVNLKVTGIDFSAAMIDLAKTYYPKADFKVADAEDLPFKNETFDAACCNFGVLHFPHPDKAIAEASRVCKPRARYIFTAWNVLEKSPAMSILMSAIKTHATAETNFPEGPPFFHYAAPENSFPALEQAGFKNPERQEIALTWPMQSADFFVRSFYDGGARIGGVLRAQSAATMQKIIGEIAANIALYKSGDSYAVPVSIVMTSGEK